MKDREMLQRLALAEKYFTGQGHKIIIDRATKLYYDGQHVKCAECLKKLPTVESLLESLMEKLKGKSVYKNLKAIQEGKVVDSVMKMTGLSSLMTHVLIEMKQGRREYGVLLPYIFEQLGKVVYSV